MLALAAAGLIIGFHADVNSLIHLYLLGVFTAFTLSQLGMVRHNWRRRAFSDSKRSLIYAISLNATGGALTALVGAIVIATKFGEGAWMVLIAIPALVVGFVVVGRHYADVRARLSDPGGGYLPLRGPVVLYVAALDDATAAGLRYVRAIAGNDFHAIHVADPEGLTGIAQAWRGFSGDGPPLVALPRERTVSGTITRWVRELEHLDSEIVTLVLPELFRRRSLLAILRGRTALALRLPVAGRTGHRACRRALHRGCLGARPARPGAREGERAAPDLRAQRGLPARDRLRTRARERARPRPPCRPRL